jgi:hypothetical protein
MSVRPPSPRIDVRDVNRSLRTHLWPALRDGGFRQRTDRVGWRYLDGGVDVVEVTSVGPGADAVGCTSFSFGAHVASVPRYLPLPERAAADRDGRPRPHYWNCELNQHLEKTLSQPWFEPFANPPRPRTPGSTLAHRLGLERVLRRDRHDRPDIWFVLGDGSNLDEVVVDVAKVVESTGLPLLRGFHDPCRVLALLAAGSLTMGPDSRAGAELADHARRACREQELDRSTD